jgi:hypothetical protein
MTPFRTAMCGDPATWPRNARLTDMPACLRRGRSEVLLPEVALRQDPEAWSTSASTKRPDDAVPCQFTHEFC